MLGGYFVTICTWDRLSIFGKITQGRFTPDAYGIVVQACWDQLPSHFPRIQLDAFVVMPNHVHGILFIQETGSAERLASTSNVAPGSLGALVRSFKSASTRQIIEMRRTPGRPVWQRGYYERVVRYDAELNRM